MSTRKSFRFLHRWLGIFSGGIVLLLCVTGCLFSFSTEIGRWFRSESLYVTPGNSVLPVDFLWQKAQAELGTDKPVSWGYMYSDPVKAWAFSAYATNPSAISYFKNIRHYETVYLNPYTGEVTGTFNDKYDFFNLVKMLHWSLWLRTDIGQPITGTATLLFVVLIFTGILLWWPKKRKHLKQRLRFQWKPGFRLKRKLYDVHSILGFYVLFIALVTSFTGLVWAFPWMKQAVYEVAKGNTETLQYPESSKIPAPNRVVSDLPFEAIYRNVSDRYPYANAFRLLPKEGSPATVSVYVQLMDDRYSHHHELTYEKETGALLHVLEHQQKNRGEKLIAANYDIHVGSYWGMTGKLIMFLGCLVMGSLPVTGIWLWWKGGKKR